LEEGCVHISKITLEKDEDASGKRRYDSSTVEQDIQDTDSVEDEADHPKLRMQWGWTELEKGATR
jgi:hypothetical protein